MPKRVGGLMDRVLDYDNCFEGVLEATAQIKKTDLVQDIRNRPHDYARLVQKTIKNGWVPGPIRYKILKEGPARKKRKLVIANTIDHIIHVVIMRVIQPILERRFDFYTCGSIKNRGQRRCMDALKGWIKTKDYKYAAEADVYHFYDNCKAEVVMRLLRKIIKDEAYLHLHELILDQMCGKDVEIINESDEDYDLKGIAIGFSPSHWYGNLILTETDRLLREKFRGVKFVRYVDNYVMLSNRKRRLHKAIRAVNEKLSELGLRLKDDWQVFPIKVRPIHFLSYRYYFSGKVLLSKRNLYRLSRKAKRTAARPNAHNCRSFMSVVGLAKKANVFNYLKDRVYSVVSLKYCKKIISNYDKKHNAQGDNSK